MDEGMLAQTCIDESIGDNNGFLPPGPSLRRPCRSAYQNRHQNVCPLFLSLCHHPVALDQLQSIVERPATRGTHRLLTPCGAHTASSCSRRVHQVFSVTAKRFYFLAGDEEDLAMTEELMRALLLDHYFGNNQAAVTSERNRLRESMSPMKPQPPPDGVAAAAHGAVLLDGAGLGGVTAALFEVLRAVNLEAFAAALSREGYTEPADVAAAGASVICQAFLPSVFLSLSSVFLPMRATMAPTVLPCCAPRCAAHIS